MLFFIHSNIINLIIITRILLNKDLFHQNVILIKKMFAKTIVNVISMMLQIADTMNLIEIN